MKSRLWLWAALALTLFMPSSDSLWIDEAQTAAYAQQPTLRAWADRIQHDHFSEAQMPLGMAVFWATEKILGHGEWQLRAVNILFTAASVWIVWLIGLRFRVPALALVVAVHPFVWYYANEARPYALQIAGGAALLLVAVKLAQEERVAFSTVVVWSISVLVLCASSMLGVIPAALGSLWLALSLVRRRERLGWSSIGIIGLTGILILLLGFYYLRTLQRGAGGAALWSVSLNNLAFSAYEILGFTGLGPPRQALREAFASGTVFGTIRPYLLPLAVFSIANLFLLKSSVAWISRARDRAVGLFLFGLPLFSAVALFALASAVQFPFWGRHLAPVAPFVIIVLSLPALLDGKYVALAAWALLCFLSALELRLAPRHAKDDNRSAARLALQAVSEGQHVWWSADRRSAEYYGINFGQEIPLVPPVLSDLPDVIITCKPDIFDPSRQVANFLEANSYRPAEKFQAITVWRR